MMHQLLSNSPFSDRQFGFLFGRPTCTQLLAALNKWYNSYNSGINICIVYTGIFNAFNTVSHTKLLSVLKSYDIANDTFKWICAFITDRCHYVRINTGNAFSSFLPITNGCWQGSVLGPLSFLIFIINLTFLPS